MAILLGQTVMIMMPTHTPMMVFRSLSILARYRFCSLGFVNGLYWLDPDNTSPFEAYCRWRAMGVGRWLWSIQDILTTMILYGQQPP